MFLSQPTGSETCLFEKADVTQYRSEIVSRLLSGTNGSLTVFSGDASDKAHILQETPEVPSFRFHFETLDCLLNYQINTKYQLQCRTWALISDKGELQRYPCARIICNWSATPKVNRLPKYHVWNCIHPFSFYRKWMDFLGWNDIYSIRKESDSILGADIDIRGGENIHQFADQLAAFAEQMWTGQSEQKNVACPNPKSRDWISGFLPICSDF